MAYIKPPESSEIEWYTGAPPAIGWWPASINRDVRVLRWWDGRVWSIAVLDTCRASYAARIALLPAIRSAPHIEWCARWWE